jgi:hypothetical protein
MKTVDFHLTDADGEQHKYVVELFNCDESVRLQLMVAAPLFDLVGQLLSALVPALGKGKLSELLKSTDAIAAGLQRVDWSTLPGALSALPAAIEERGGPVLIERVFAKTTRLVPIPEAQGAPSVTDGEPVTDVRQQLAQSDWRDLAFGDGNYAELWSAFVMVLVVNFTRYGRNGSPGLKSAVETLTAGLVTVSPRSTETTAPKSGTSSASSQPTS